MHFFIQFFNFLSLHPLEGYFEVSNLQKIFLTYFKFFNELAWPFLNLVQADLNWVVGRSINGHGNWFKNLEQNQYMYFIWVTFGHILRGRRGCLPSKKSTSTLHRRSNRMNEPIWERHQS